MSDEIIRIKNIDLIEDLIGSDTEFPKYTTQIINLANQNAQGTRPKVVGQMSDLIQEFPGYQYHEWVSWYLEKNPNAIKDATLKIYDMINKLKTAIKEIDKKMVREWVQDLIFTKTFIGLKFQESILKRIAEKYHLKYRLAKPNEESKGIDGYIGKTPVSIKSITYKSKNMLNEKIDVKLIFYEKMKDGIEVFYDSSLFKNRSNPDLLSYLDD